MIENTHLIHTKGNRKNFVVCTGSGRRSKLDVELGMLHAIGYWCGNKEEVDTPEIKEVWIPFTEISHVESLVYRQRA